MDDLELPLLHATPAAWAAIAAGDLRVFLSDHAVCEQQAALSALALIGWYPGDEELVGRMAALAAEEISHLRRVLAIVHRRGWKPLGRRPNPWAQGLRRQIETGSEPWQRVDRLLVGALIEARSCERFTLLGRELAARHAEPEVAELLQDLGPAEARHWRLFHRLAQTEVGETALEPRWRRWLEREAELNAEGGRRATVHG